LRKSFDGTTPMVDFQGLTLSYSMKLAWAALAAPNSATIPIVLRRKRLLMDYLRLRGDDSATEKCTPHAGRAFADQDQ
jgi:hypothetical protein